MHIYPIFQTITRLEAFILFLYGNEGEKNSDNERREMGLKHMSDAHIVRDFTGLPGLPSDWWKCQRIGPVSGRYEGVALRGVLGLDFLDLRVDIVSTIY